MLHRLRRHAHLYARQAAKRAVRRRHGLTAAAVIAVAAGATTSASGDSLSLAPEPTSTTPATFGDTHEPNDRVAQATPITLGTAAQGVVASNVDHDWFSVTAGAHAWSTPNGKLAAVGVVLDDQGVSFLPGIGLPLGGSAFNGSCSDAVGLAVFEHGHRVGAADRRADQPETILFGTPGTRFKLEVTAQSGVVCPGGTRYRLAVGAMERTGPHSGIDYTVHDATVVPPDPYAASGHVLGSSVVSVNTQVCSYYDGQIVAMRRQAKQGSATQRAAARTRLAHDIALHATYHCP